MPVVSYQLEMNSNAEIYDPPAQTHSQNGDLIHELHNETDMASASRSSPSISRRELDNLRSSNPPGRSELAPLKLSRSRSSSYQKAKKIFVEALRATQRELVEFDAQKYLLQSPENMPLTDVRPMYRKLCMREQALILASEDLCPLLEKSGLIHEARTVPEEVNSALVPITNIKLTYKDVVSIMTDLAREEPDVESLRQNTTPGHQNTSPILWSTSTALL